MKGRTLRIALLVLVGVCTLFPAVESADDYSGPSGGFVCPSGQCQTWSTGQNEWQARVVAGTQGRITLTASIEPSSYIVQIEAVSLPYWALFTPAWGYGSVSAECTFTAPQVSTETTFDFIFRASYPGTPLAPQLITYHVTVVPAQMILTYSVVTNPLGVFRISVPSGAVQETVVGRLWECTKRLLPSTQFTLTLVPRLGSSGYSGLSSIGAVSISAPGYRPATVTQFTYSQGQLDLGDVSLLPYSGGECGAPCDMTGVTGNDGSFTVSLPISGAILTGKLSVCTAAPLSSSSFCLTLVPKGRSISSAADIAGFTFSADGLTPTTVTDFGQFTLFGMTTFSVSTVSLLPILPGGEPLAIGEVVHGVFKSGMTAPDGVIGPEWDDVPGTEMAIPGSDAPAVLKVAYDDKSIYYAIASPLPTGFGAASGIELTVDGGEGIGQESGDSDWGYSVEASQPVSSIPTSGVPLTAMGPMPLTLTLFGTSEVCSKPVDVSFTGGIVFDSATIPPDVELLEPPAVVSLPCNAPTSELACAACPTPEPGFALVGYTRVRDSVSVEALGRDIPDDGGYVHLRSVTVTEDAAVTSDETLACVYDPIPYSCPAARPGYRIVGYTHVRDHVVVEYWGADAPSESGYLYVESRTTVRDGVTEEDEIWTCVYEPE